jgi:hypothetical protein
MLVAAVCGCGPYERLTIDRTIALLTSARGGRRGVPATARHIVVITRVGVRQRGYADELADRLLQCGTDCITLPPIENS